MSSRHRTPPDAVDTIIETLPGGRPIRDEITRPQLPAIEIPPHAARILEKQHEGPPNEDTAPRLGGYALVARFPSSAAADVFLGYKVSSFGFMRRAVVKFVDARRPDYGLAQRGLVDEARAIASLDHPNVVSIYDHEVGAEGSHLAVEYVAGTDLRRVLGELGRRSERLPEALALFLTAEVLRGLVHVHEAADSEGARLGIIHRDVNPSNVLLGDDGRVKITDFGTVRMSGRAQPATLPGMVKGKVRYLAPEYISDQQCTHQVDVYGVGVMLYEMLSGRPSFAAGSNVDIMIDIVRTGLGYEALDRSGVSPDLSDLVRRATHRDPEHRFNDAARFLEAIEDYLDGAGLFSSPTRLAQHLSRHDLVC